MFAAQQSVYRHGARPAPAVLSGSITAIGNEAVDYPDDVLLNILKPLIRNAGDDDGHFMQVDGARVGVKRDEVSFLELRAGHDNFFSAFAPLPGYIGDTGLFFADGDERGMRRNSPLL